MDSEPGLLYPFSLSSFSTFLLAAVLFLVFFHFCSTSFSIFPSFFSVPLLFFSSCLASPSLLPKARHYYQIIKRPMDLSIIRRKLQKKDPAHYTTPEEVVSDVRLMFWNCAKFNYVCLACFSSPLFPSDPKIHGWMGISGLVLSCHEDLGTGSLHPPPKFSPTLGPQHGLRRTKGEC